MKRKMSLFTQALTQSKIRITVFIFSISTLLLVIFLTSTNFYYLYQKVSSSQQGIIFSELEKKALMLASVIDMDAYEKLLASNEIDSGAEYQKVIGPLRNTHFSIDGLRYVYTVYRKPINGKMAVYFGLDTALKIDLDNDKIIDHSDFRSAYNEAPNEIHEAVKSGRLAFTHEPYTDKYGTFISAFVPLKNKKGEVVSVLGVDMLYTQYKNLIEGYRNTILRIYLISIGLILVFTLTLYFLYNKMSKYKIQELSLKNEIKEQQNFFIQESKMSEVGKMVAGITHEINNPLTIIKGLSDQGLKRLQREQFDVELHRKNYENIKNSTDRIIEVIKNMKSIVARPVGTDEFYYFSLDECLENVMKAIRYKSISESVRFDIQVTGSLLLYGNRSQLEQVFFNLISNSIDAIAADVDPWIKIEVDEEDQFFNLHFIDSGTTFTQELFNKVDQGYYTSKSNGSGMGLMICKKIIGIHYGTLMYIQDSKTHFVIKLPKNEEIHAAHEEAHEAS